MLISVDFCHFVMIECACLHCKVLIGVSGCMWCVCMYVCLCMYVYVCMYVVQPGGDAREVYYSYGEGETARTVRLLRTPEKTGEGMGPDAFEDKRPLVAVVKKGR